MLHACFTPIALYFVYTLWHFYAFSGTNLLTNATVPVPIFCCFLFQAFTEGNILGIGRNKSRSFYFADTNTESKGEMETSNEPATPGGGVAHPLVALPHGMGPLGVHRPRPSAYKFTSSRKP
jgi:hypothetical protein